jgi:hypothetical protein
MSRPLFVDLDATLIDSDVDARGNVIRITPRPGVAKFLEKLSRHGDLFLLTHATRPHVEEAFQAIGAPAQFFHGVISREDMGPIIEQIDYLMNDRRLTSVERAMLYQEIQPLAPRGYVFDDQPVGSELYLIKSATVGARPKDWIQVKPFNRRATAGQELERAYQEYRRRAAGPHTVLAGRAVRVTG